MERRRKALLFAITDDKEQKTDFRKESEVFIMTAKKTTKKVEGEKKAGKKKASFLRAFLPAITLLLGVLFGALFVLVSIPTTKVLPNEPNGVGARVVELEKRVADLTATLKAERTRVGAEFMRKDVELMDANGVIEAQRIAFNDLKKESAKELEKKVKEFLAEKERMQKDFVSRMASRDAEWELKVAEWELKVDSLRMEISSLESQIKTLREGKAKLNSASAGDIQQIRAEYEARIKVLNEALEKAICEKNEALARAMKAENGFSGVKQILFSVGERIRIEKVEVCDSLQSELKKVVIKGKVMSCGNFVSILCFTTEKEAGLLKPGKILRIDNRDVFLQCGNSLVLSRSGIFYPAS